jgi:hypothetical protein
MFSATMASFSGTVATSHGSTFGINERVFTYPVNLQTGRPCGGTWSSRTGASAGHNRPKVASDRRV